MTYEADATRTDFKGKTIKEIARDLKASRNTVRKVLRSGETSFERANARLPLASESLHLRDRPGRNGTILKPGIR
jgi:predicted transcriptional regulator